MAGSSQRAEWADAAKGIGILFVVFGHVWRGLWDAGIIEHDALFTGIDNAIYLFHMPLFFLLSGVFFEGSVKRLGVLPSILRRVETLLYPMLIWSWAMALLLLLAGSATNRGAIDLYNAVLYPFPPKDIFWFLAALFLIQAACAFVVYQRTRWLIALFVLALIPAEMVALHASAGLLGNIAENAPFFLFGMLLNRLDMFGISETRKTAVLGAAAFAFSLKAAFFFGQQPGALGSLLSLIAALGFGAMIYALFPRLPRWAIAPLSQLGTASMAIYVMHVAPSAATRMVLLAIGMNDLWVHMVIATILGTLCPMLVWYALTRYGLLRLFGLGSDVRAGRTKLVPA